MRKFATKNAIPLAETRKHARIVRLPQSSVLSPQSFPRPPNFRRPTAFLLLLPSLAVIGLFLVGGVGFAFAQSLGMFALLGDSEVTFRHYRDVLRDPDFGSALVVSLRISVVSTLIALTISVGMALLLRKRLRGDGILRLLFQLPLPIPHLVGAVGITLLVAQSGLIARLLHAAGLLTER
ncbi:MAG: hypothetical protein M3Z19_09495, partial [Chloroflexota bacterium]|nr:hypothetical protein [Chloroflexota bacterium]